VTYDIGTVLRSRNLSAYTHSVLFGGRCFGIACHWVSKSATLA
jgi:hypothetical protein